MFVGGEFYEDEAWIRDMPTLSTGGMYFLNGGRACLTVISDYLLDHGIDRVLLPSYLCPSIVKTFQDCGIGWDFYQVHEDLSIDLHDLAQKINPFQAVYLINYFGFSHPLATQNYFKMLQQNNILVIEDNAQAGFPPHRIGDFAINSIRKLAAYDGGYLSTQYDLSAYLKKYAGYPNRRLPLIRKYRQNLYHYLFDQEGSFDELNQLFEQATEYYETDRVVLGDIDERQRIERLDWDGIRLARRDNFNYLMEWVTSIPQIEPIYTRLQYDNMPFGLPVYFSDGARDRVYEELGKAGIGLTIHWEDICTDPRTHQNPLAVKMAGKMLTLPVDQRTTHKQMDYLAMNLIRAIAAAKSA